QASLNRREIIFLVIRVCSPLLLAAIAGACCWLWYTIKAYFRQEPPPEPVQLRESMPPSSPVGQRKASVSSTQESGQRGAPSLSVTPIPPVLFNAAAGQGSMQPAWQEAEGEEESSDPAERAQEQSPDGMSAGHGIAPTSAPKDLELPGEETVSDAGVARTPFYVTITLLKELNLTLHVPGGKRLRVPLHLNAKETQLIAYLAWLDAQSRGQTISLDKLREHIFGYGRADEDATPKKLQDALDSAKKEIRRQLRQATQQVNQEAGDEVIPPNLDIFAIRNKRYGLAEVCRVADLAVIEAQHQLIQQAFDEGLLVDTVPEVFKEACDRLRKAYAGDFLADLLHDSPEEVGTWVRKPFTLYRDYFLQAVLYAAEYELRAGQQLADEHLDDEGEAAEERRKRQRAHYSRAAQLYHTYAMRACDNRFDLKVTFGGSGRAHGERVDMSERTLRRCITLYGILGSTHMVNQVYSAYYKLMKTISAKAWEPSKETLQDLQGAQAQTNAYRFPAKVMPHEPPPPHLERGGSS
ncbi:MAG: helix-turn-helix domain-containing protein, partial [Ktedonobacteraceae bacterium]